MREPAYKSLSPGGRGKGEGAVVIKIESNVGAYKAEPGNERYRGGEENPTLWKGISCNYRQRFFRLYLW